MSLSIFTLYKNRRDPNTPMYVACMLSSLINAINGCRYSCLMMVASAHFTELCSVFSGFSFFFRLAITMKTRKKRENKIEEIALKFDRNIFMTNLREKTPKTFILLCISIRIAQFNFTLHVQILFDSMQEIPYTIKQWVYSLPIKCVRSYLVSNRTSSEIGD